MSNIPRQIKGDGTQRVIIVCNNILKVLVFGSIFYGNFGLNVGDDKPIQINFMIAVI